MATDKQTTKMQRKRKRQMVTQRFFNFAYSIGAAIVIWGALFKILHLPMGNLLLTIGMGTEVLMFIITAFERPEKEYHWEDVFPILDTGNPEDRPDFVGGPGGNVTINGDISGAAGETDGAQINISASGSNGVPTPPTPGTAISINELPSEGGPSVVASPEVAEAIASMSQQDVKAVMDSISSRADCRKL